MTLEQAKEINGLTQEQKQLLLNIETTAKRFNREPKTFAATNATELKKELDTIIEKKRTKQSKAKEKQSAKKQCIAILKELAEGQNALTSYSQLLERLQSIRAEIEKENKQNKLEQLIEQSGLTRNEVIEYLNNN
jgi:hypothetical protein